MAGYVDVYMLPIPRKNLTAYRRLAKAWGRIMRSHGMLRYREYVAAKGGEMKGMPGMAQLAKPREGEVAIVAVSEFRSRAHRDKVNKAGMKDPRMAKLMTAMPPFDMKKMRMGGFETLVAAP